MFTTKFRQQVAAILCTMLMSTACVLSAVGPAEAGGGARNNGSVVAKAAHFVA